MQQFLYAVFLCFSNLREAVTAGRTARFQLTVLSDQWLMAQPSGHLSVVFVSNDSKNRCLLEPVGHISR